MSDYMPFHAPWQDSPSTATPVTAAALDHMEAGIAAGVNRKAWIDLRDAGVVIGEPDSSAKIQGLLDQAEAIVNTFGGAVVLHPAKYNLLADGLKLGTGVVYLGANRWSSRLGLKTGATGPLFSLKAGTDLYTGVQSCTLVGQKATQNITTTATASAATNIITAAGHGLTTSTLLRFTALTGGTGLGLGVQYYARDVTTDTFRVALTDGGTPIDITADLTAGTFARAQHAIFLEGTVPSALTEHRCNRLTISGFTGDGVHQGGYTRSTALHEIRTYQCDGYGFVLGGSDSLHGMLEAGSSGLAGFRVAAGSVNVAVAKAWQSGRLDGVSPNILVEASDVALAAVESQESAGSGITVFKTGLRLDGITIVGKSSSDNLANTGGAALNVFNCEGSQFDIVVDEFAGSASPGVLAVAAINSSDDCTVVLNAADGSWTGANPVTGDSLALNDINFNGMRERRVTTTYAATVTPSAWGPQTVLVTLTGNLTIANPAQKPTNGRLRFVLTQDATGGRTVTFGSDFVANWTPSTTAGAVNIIEFLCDGTKWHQASSSEDAGPGGGGGVAAVDFGLAFPYRKYVTQSDFSADYLPLGRKLQGISSPMTQQALDEMAGLIAALVGTGTGLLAYYYTNPNSGSYALAVGTTSVRLTDTVTPVTFPDFVIPASGDIEVTVFGRTGSVSTPTNPKIALLDNTNTAVGGKKFLIPTAANTRFTIPIVALDVGTPGATLSGWGIGGEVATGGEAIALDNANGPFYAKITALP